MISRKKKKKLTFSTISLRRSMPALYSWFEFCQFTNFANQVREYMYITKQFMFACFSPVLLSIALSMSCPNITGRSSHLVNTERCVCGEIPRFLVPVIVKDHRSTTKECHHFRSRIPHATPRWDHIRLHC